MTESVKEQLSACLDGELPRGELDLLLKRLERDPQLRGSIGRYALLGEVLRAERPVTATSTFADKVFAAIEAEPARSASLPLSTPAFGTSASNPVSAVPLAARARGGIARWLQPAAGLAVAAGVAAIAVLALQPATDSLPPEQIAANAPLTAPAPSAQPGSNAPSSYTVPTNTASSDYIPAARLTNYVVAHSEYSSPLGRRTVLSGVLSDEDEDVAVSGPAQEPAGPDDAGALPPVVPL
ncbi:MAG TPA: sigma-E factor negative regulatory protein [Steroidobacteraceae bacterium]|jgi:negative regulator of sigma E activity